ncbi:MAG: alpha/beta hydrolase [Acidobacteria bacterium]|nr:alpha/beta hydrolase [Acidobacteriota bacterium]
MPFVAGPDCRLWVDRRGEGEPVTVFAHGVTSSADEVAPMAARAPGTRVLFDFRGHGRSDSPPERAGYGHDAMRRDLETVADRFGATRAFGVSMGAGAIMNLLADHPDRFERVAFFIPASIDSSARQAADSFIAFAERLETGDLDAVAEMLLAAPEFAPLFERRPRWRALVRRRVMRMNATGVSRALRAFAAGPAPVADSEALRRVAAPALVLGHEGDPIHPAAVARRLGELLPGAEVRIWPEPLSMLDRPAEFAALVGRFLGGSPA